MKKPVNEQVPVSPSASFSVEAIALPHFISAWHFHSVNEILLIQESTGTGFVGDAIVPFGPGMVSLVAAGLPHVWLNGKAYYEEKSGLTARAVVIKFGDDLPVGAGSAAAPELAPVRALLTRAARGLTFCGAEGEVLAGKIAAMPACSGLRRFIGLLDILDTMAGSACAAYCASEGYCQPGITRGSDKAAATCEFIMRNFSRPLSLWEVAGVACMAPNAFCRFFRRTFLKSFKQFLGEVRIGHACRLLLEKETSVSSAAFASGFNNLTHFNRQFRKNTGFTPREFLRRHAVFSIPPDNEED